MCFSFFYAISSITSTIWYYLQSKPITKLKPRIRTRGVDSCIYCEWLKQRAFVIYPFSFLFMVLFFAFWWLNFFSVEISSIVIGKGYQPNVRKTLDFFSWRVSFFSMHSKMRDGKNSRQMKGIVVLIVACIQVWCNDQICPMPISASKLWWNLNRSQVFSRILQLQLKSLVSHFKPRLTILGYLNCQ